MSISGVLKNETASETMALSSGGAEAARAVPLPTSERFMKLIQILNKLFCIHEWEKTLDEKVYHIGVTGKKEWNGTNKIWVCKGCGEMKMYHY